MGNGYSPSEMAFLMPFPFQMGISPEIPPVMQFVVTGFLLIVISLVLE